MQKTTPDKTGTGVMLVVKKAAKLYTKPAGKPLDWEQSPPYKAPPYKADTNEPDAGVQEMQGCRRCRGANSAPVKKMH